MAEYPNTDLTRDQYTQKANEWIKNNPKEWKEIKAKAKAGGPKAFQRLGTILKEKYGQPHWQDAPGRSKVKGSMPTKNKPGVDFTIYDRGAGKGVGFKSNPNRKVTRGGGSQGSRKINEKISTPRQTPAQKLKFGKAMTDASKRGLEGDHDNPVYRTGNALKLMDPIRRALYFQRLRKAGQFTGNDARNITARTGEVNRGRNLEFNELDRAIQKAGKETDEVLGKNNKVKINGKNGRNGRNRGNGRLKINGGFGQNPRTKGRFGDFGEGNIPGYRPVQKIQIPGTLLTLPMA
tara:strand:+ start:249 stop:1124 length:876 start_codon:yes stop_codon:yes gene_type:complete